MKTSLHASSVALALVASSLAPDAQRATAAPRSPSTPPPATADAIAFPACAKALDDTSGPGCLYAASRPTLGKLFPLSSDFFIDAATGNVSLGGTSPTHRLEVLGTGWFTDDLAFRDSSDSLVFPSVGPAARR